MHALNVVTLLFVILGGLNWLLVGVLDLDLIAAAFGGSAAPAARLAYLIVGASALWQFVPMFRSFDVDEAQVLADADATVRRPEPDAKP